MLPLSMAVLGWGGGGGCQQIITANPGASRNLETRAGGRHLPPGRTLPPVTQEEDAGGPTRPPGVSPTYGRRLDNQSLTSGVTA